MERNGARRLELNGHPGSIVNKKCEIFLAAAQNGLLDRPLLLRLPPHTRGMGPAKQLYQIRRITYPAARFFTAAEHVLDRDGTARRRCATPACGPGADPYGFWPAATPNGHGHPQCLVQLVVGYMWAAF